MKPYEIIDHTADIGIKARGVTLIELFENSAKGMFHIISCGKGPLKGERVTKKLEIKNTTDVLEDLLVNWLSELLYIFSKEKICIDSFRILGLNNSGLTAEIEGSTIDLYQSSSYTEIKAVTFHNLKIEEAVEGFSCAIIFDV
ncbi:MAG: archease [Candidatus Omnitrophota bacterium]|nr:archease [Candidatus Omnitrophota bacterium]